MTAGLRLRRLAVLRVLVRPRAAVRLMLELAERNARLDRQLDCAIRAAVIMSSGKNMLSAR